MDWLHSPLAFEIEAESVRRLRLREVAASLELYEMYGKVILALILNIVGDRQIAEELLAESLLKATKQIQHLGDNQFSLGPWLLILTRNEALKFRDQTLAPEGKPRDWRVLEAPALHCAREPWPECSAPGQAIQRAFTQLPERDRLILELAWFEALTFDEIAVRLDRPISEVVASAKDALVQLREAEP